MARALIRASWPSQRRLLLLPQAAGREVNPLHNKEEHRTWEESVHKVVGGLALVF